MAVTTAYSSLYSAAAVPLKSAGRPRSSNVGGNSDLVEYTVPTTQIDDATDFTYLIPVRSGKRIAFLIFDAAALAATNLDLDIVLRSVNSAGTVTDTILFNAGTAFTAAQAGKWVWCNALIPETPTGIAHIGLLCNVAGGTPAAGAVKLYAEVL